MAVFKGLYYGSIDHSTCGWGEAGTTVKPMKGTEFPIIADHDHDNKLLP